MYSCFCKSTKMYIQLRVPTYNHNYFVFHCCFGFSASARNDVTARASSWLVNAARISAKVQIFQLAQFARQTLNSRHVKRSIRAASFARIAPQDCLSRLCIDLTCKSFARFTSFASGVNAPSDASHAEELLPLTGWNALIIEHLSIRSRIFILHLHLVI